MISEIEGVVALLEELVSFNSVNRNLGGTSNPEVDMHLFIEKWARSAGFETERLAIDSENFNLLITHRLSADAPWILFEAHSDTVGIEGMIVEPFKAVIKNGKIFGRGVCDTKGSGAAMLWALQEYSTGAHQFQNIAILFVTDEEVSKTGANTFVAKHLPDISWRPLGVVVGEPSNCEMIVAHNGVIRWRVATSGIAAHSSNPSLGQSAISAMSKVILAFEKQYCEKLNLFHDLTGKAACSINTIGGGTSVNIIPSHCEVQIDRRVLPGEVASEVIKEYTRVLNEIAAEDPNIELEILPPFIDRALDPEIGKEFAAKIASVLESLNYASTPCGVGYGTDASTYSHRKIPTIVLGPGSIEQAHTRDEWLLISELEKAVEIYGAIMRTAL